MNNRLRKIFFPNKQEIEKFKQQLLQEQKKSIERRNKIKLIKCNNILFVSEPFNTFMGDCEQCSHYLNSPYDFVTGGDCLLHNIPCGYGHICKDNDSHYNDDWKEFIKVKKGDEK